jgi:hypothetical protein
MEKLAGPAPLSGENAVSKSTNQKEIRYQFGAFLIILSEVWY